MSSHAVLAAAGGGSAGFGGGGEGGGGRGAGLYILIQILIRIAILGHGLGAVILFALILMVVLVRRGVPSAHRFWQARRDAGPARRRQADQRQRRVELAAAEAAEDDPIFAPEHVRARAALLFKMIQAAWDAGDRRRLAALVAPRLLAEWERRLDDFAGRGWRNHVQVIGEPTIEYVGLENRGGHEQDRVTVRVEAKMRDYVVDAAGHHLKREGRLGEIVHVREYWTLGRRGEDWVLFSIEQGAEGSHALKDRIVATAWSDDQRLRDEALVEQANADAVPATVAVAEVADLDFDGDARAAALDLSLADGRFAPDVLEVAARRAVAAWTDAIDGNDAPLRAIARPQAAAELLQPGDPGGHTRLVVRGLQVRQIRIVALDAAAHPPTMSIEVQLHGIHYLENRATTAVVAGSKSVPSTFTERWTLALDGDPAQPWRIAAVSGTFAHA